MNNLKLSVVTGSFNEAENVNDWFDAIFKAWVSVKDEFGFSELEIIWIDNASSDDTVNKVKVWCDRDPRVKLIVNARNFGPVRSPFHGLMQAHGDVCVFLASDLQDPPELIRDFLAQWKQGVDVVAGVYKGSEDTWIFKKLRSAFYKVMNAVSETEQIRAFTGFGLYTRKAVDLLKMHAGPMPYVRGLVTDLGLSVAEVSYFKPKRKYGVSKNDLMLLIDQAIIGMTSMSRTPLRVTTLVGGFMSLLSFLLGLGYLCLKIWNWNYFDAGLAPLLIGMFFLGSIQILFLGILGEYVSALMVGVQNRPLVVEKERVNFKD